MEETKGIDKTEKQRIIKGYYEKSCANKLDNLEKMDTFLEAYNLPKLNQKEIENLNRFLTSKKKMNHLIKTPNKHKFRIRWLHQ